MQVSRDKKDQIRTVERFLLDQHATFRNNLNRFGEPLPQQIAVFLRDLQDGLLAKLQLGLFKQHLSTLVYSLISPWPRGNQAAYVISSLLVVSDVLCHI